MSKLYSVSDGSEVDLNHEDIYADLFRICNHGELGTLPPHLDDGSSSVRKIPRIVLH